MNVLNAERSRTQTDFDRWNRAYIAALVLAVAVAAFAGFSQFKTITRSKDLVVIQSKIGRENDRLLQVQLSDRDSRIAELNEKAGELNKKAGEAIERAGDAESKVAEADARTAIARKESAEASVKAESFRLDIAQANERAAKAEQRAVEAQAQVAGATAEAAKANLELARLRTPRSLTSVSDIQRYRVYIYVSISRRRGYAVVAGN